MSVHPVKGFYWEGRSVDHKGLLEVKLRKDRVLTQPLFGFFLLTLLFAFHDGGLRKITEFLVVLNTAVG